MEKKNRSSSGECNRCGSLCGFSIGYHKLADIYEAVLCVDCLSDWNLFYASHELCNRVQTCCDERHTIFQQIQFDGKERTEQLAENFKAYQELEQQAFTVAESFVLDRIERTQPEPPPPLTDEEILEREAKKFRARENNSYSIY